ncbi:unnamed protein product [Caenorhabditis auriculariae]|uniref:Dimethylargininase n=1 Tax=Caenorhabditis auriculariae TaxID=2777116 RepID=A0A8S1H2E5_9PELO|nr:unnamed protein product [Caenorhabditis auriculariae]
MRYTHALVPSFPQVLKLEKKQNIDIELLRGEYAAFLDHLKEAGVNLVEFPTSTISSSSMYLEESAVVINGTALICSIPENLCVRVEDLVSALENLSWTVRHIPLKFKGKKVLLNASDVFFTGKEIFVGVHKNSTNKEGVAVLSETYCDYAVIPVYMSDKALALKNYISFCAEEVLAIASGKEADAILKRVERETALIYKKLTLKESEVANCIFVNGTLLFQHDQSVQFLPLEKEKIRLHPVNSTQLTKLAPYFSRLCVFVKNIQTARGVEFNSNDITLRAI